MASEIDLISIFLNSIYDPYVKYTQVLPEITITPHPQGLRMSHELTSGQIELERAPVRQHAKGKQAPASEPEGIVTIRLDNVFGRSKTIKLGPGWVQVDGELFEYKGKAPGVDSSLVG
jgi:hypothetical protein